MINHFIPQFDIECKYSQVYFIDYKFKKKTEAKTQKTTTARSSIRSTIKSKQLK